MRFEFYRLRFHFQARESLYFPPGKSANILRGAFGLIFRQIACVPACRGASGCEIRASCPYARVFEPQAAAGCGPSGLADWPRPFVFRAAHLDGRVIPPGESFHFDLHLFDLREPPLAYFVLAFTQLVREGLGPRRGRAELVAVDQLDLAGTPSSLSGQGVLPAPPCAFELAGGSTNVDRVTVRFVTPTELKSGQQIASRPEFPVLFARLRDRLSTLRALYGPGPLEIDFRSMAERAASVRMTHCELRHREVERRSSRTGQSHPISGFVGEARYEGSLDEFLPYLHAGKWTGVGRQTVWGKGEIEVL